MKRPVVSIVMLVLILLLSVMNTFTLYNIRVELTQVLQNISDKLEAEGPHAVVKDAEEFEKLWLEREEKLLRFIRHSDLEQITWDSARLPYLAKYGDTAELAAELNRIHLQVNHLWETQVPRLQTVF